MIIVFPFIVLKYFSFCCHSSHSVLCCNRLVYSCFILIVKSDSNFNLNSSCYSFKSFHICLSSFFVNHLFFVFLSPNLFILYFFSLCYFVFISFCLSYSSVFFLLFCLFFIFLSHILSPIFLSFLGFIFTFSLVYFLIFLLEYLSI